MPYFLKHRFDPDFNHLKRKPSEREDGRLDHYNLNYVQNVLKGDVLAEWQEVTEADAVELDQRHLYPKKVFPRGPRTEVNPENPDQLLAADDGYVFYDAGLIRVKKLLNVRQDVDFSTGNVSFVNNMVVHGAVNPGFRVQAKNVGGGGGRPPGAPGPRRAPATAAAAVTAPPAPRPAAHADATRARQP
jgi:hypothetical protein